MKDEKVLQILDTVFGALISAVIILLIFAIFGLTPGQIRRTHESALVQRGLAVYSADDTGKVQWHWKDHPEDTTIEAKH